jgi:preprotein translocase subunit SecA
MLLDEKIPHSVLNANNAFWEAEIIKEAGKRGTVTVATSMAGRGTDIHLGEGVKELGGLAVIGIGRMANIRSERQARGRAGRQGDPGFSQFFVSLEDDVVADNGPSNLDKYIDRKRKMGRRRLKRIINGAQKTGEEIAVSSRKHAVEYDFVLQLQRQLMYSTRDKLLDGGALSDKKIRELSERNIDRFLAKNKNLDNHKLSRYILDNISYELDAKHAKIHCDDKAAVRKYLVEKVRKSLRSQKTKLAPTGKMADFTRVAALNAIDDAWVEQVDYLQQLQSAVSGRASAQRNLIYEYQKEALDSFRRMEDTILNNIMRNILLSSAYVDEEDKLHILLP